MPNRTPSKAKGIQQPDVHVKNITQGSTKPQRNKTTKGIGGSD